MNGKRVFILRKEVALNSDIHLNLNGVNSKEDIKLYIKMVYDWLLDSHASHYILNGDISFIKEQVLFYREEVINLFGNNIEFHYTNGNHDIGKGNGMTVEEYSKRKSEDVYHLKNSPIFSEDKVILGMDTLYDYSFYNKDLDSENQLHEEQVKALLALTNKRLFDDNVEDFEALKRLSDNCILSAEENMQEYQNKEIVFVSHYIPKKEFVARNTLQDSHLALKNAMIGTDKIGSMLERNNVTKAYFGPTHRRLGDTFNNIEYICQPVGLVKDWKKYSNEKTLANGFTIYTKESIQEVESYLKEYNPNPQVLNMFLQTIETVQWL